MAKSYVSPGVYVKEVDVSFLGPGVGAIGPAILGLAPQGPAYVPVTVTNFSEYTSVFGDLDPKYTLSYAAKAHLANGSMANIVRILGPAGRTVDGTAVTPGYSADSMWGVTAITGSSTAVLMALLEVTASADIVVTDLTSDKFFIEISGTGGAGFDPKVAVTASFLTGSENYIRKVLNTDPTLFSTVGYYVKETFDYALKTTTAAGDAVYASMSFGGIVGHTDGFLSASTPIVKSQRFGNSVEHDLFRFHTLGHGNAENGRFKISIENIRVSNAPSVNEYGKFDVLVRSFGDTDKSTSVVESFPNLSLDPSDPSYICRVIGDRHMQYSVSQDKMLVYGDYDNKSSYIRIEMMTGSWPESALPWGFRGLKKPVLSYISGTSTEEGVLSADVNDTMRDLPLVANPKDKETQSEGKDYIYWGVEFQISGSVKSRLSYYPVMTGSDADFSLALVSGSSLATHVYNASSPSDNYKQPGGTNSHTVLQPKHAKFTMPVAGGFDGFDPRLNSPLDQSQVTSVSQLGTQAVRQAIDIVADPDFIDINLLCIPGLYTSVIGDYAIDKVEDRADCFYVMDVTGSTVTAVIQEVQGRGFDTNYAAVYYPGIRVYDDVNSKIVTLPASVAALGAMAYNDRVAHPWYAPAGLNRAGLGRETIGFDVTNLQDNLKAADRDDLQENRINPIARFPDVTQGVIWGQKNLQLNPSALDRINVRRLMLRAKKLISSAVKFLVFEPNDGITQTKFRQLVNPILADIQQKQGLEAFKVVVDETVNTPDVINRNMMVGKIFLVPTKAAEVIAVDFVVSPSGASFDEA